MSKTRGLFAAVLAYTAWGLLAPVGKILLASFGPFTLNALRTTAALAFLVVLYGPRTTRRVLVALRHDLRLWLLGVGGLAVTFGAYLWSIKLLAPTIAALTIFLSPVLVSWGARRFGEEPSALFWPTLIITIGGGTWAVLEPSDGIQVEAGVGWGIALAALGMLGWTFYTLALKGLGKTYGDAELTLAAFLTSGLAFFAVAIPAERLHVDADATAWGWFAVYVIVPSILSFLLYGYAVRRVGATLVSVLLGIEIAATAVFSYYLTREGFSIDKIAGIATVLAAVTAFLAFELWRTRRPSAAIP